VPDRSAIVLAQNEIERVGLDRQGRLRLLDGFANDLPELRVEEERILALVTSVTRQIADVVDAVGTLEVRRADAERSESELGEGALDVGESLPDSNLDGLRIELRNVDERVAIVRNLIRLLERLQDENAAWTQQLDRLVESRLGPSSWPEAGTLGVSLDYIEGDLEEVSFALRRARHAAEAVQSRLAAKATDLQAGLIIDDAEARTLRGELEEQSEGAGRQAQLLARLRQVRSELEASEATLMARRREASELQQRRKSYLDQLDRLRRHRFVARRDAATRLNKRLNPAVHVDVNRSGLYDEYASAIAAALRGSGLHYTSLAPAVAERMSPRELCDAVEAGASDVVAHVVDIPVERAGRLIDVLREAGTGDIVVARVEDSVDLFLLDGADYKRTDELSTGQRCTVVLPILLCHSDVTILIDQPEDHLDNAFIVETVVETVRDRAPTAQFIFATHNANIPVLGEADRVTLMDSDGRHGFIRSAAPLDAAETRAAVARVMEGGEKAFEKRADFYSARVRS
jgi:ABC-type sugar transport system ATPase subunit